MPQFPGNTRSSQSFTKRSTNILENIYYMIIYLAKHIDDIMENLKKYGFLEKYRLPRKPKSKKLGKRVWRGIIFSHIMIGVTGRFP